MFGCGGWGQNHLRVWAELGYLVAACDADDSRLAVVEKDYPDIATSRDPTEILCLDSVDAVVVSSPAQTHHDLAVLALDAGKDVLVEKPMALSVSDAEDLLHRAEQQARVLLVGHVLEYHPGFRALRQLVDEGVLGKVLYAYSHRLNLGRVRTEENALWSFAPHDIALFLRLFGEVPAAVSCRGGAFLSEGVADVTMMQLEFPTVEAHIFVSWLHPFKEQRLVVVGSEKMAVFDDTAPPHEKLRLFTHEVEWRSGREPVAKAMGSTSVSIEAGEPLRLECEHFIHCIRTRERPRTDAQSGVNVLRVLAAGSESLSRQGESVRTSDRPSRVQVHETAVVDAGAVIGEGSRVWHFCHVMAGAQIGRDCVLGQNTFVAGGALIGDGVRIQNNVSIYDGVVLEDSVFCGPSATFTNVVTPRSEVNRHGSFVATRVKRGASLGANCTIVCGVTVGTYAFVAAGAVVTTDVPDHALVMGVPARVVGWRCLCGEALAGRDERMGCEVCGREFSMKEDDAGAIVVVLAAVGGGES